MTPIQNLNNGNYMADAVLRPRSASLEKYGIRRGLLDLRYVVEIAPGYSVGSVTRPNVWRRFWMRVLLGWVWRELEP